VGDQESAIGFVLVLARALHRYGTPAHQLEDALHVTCERLGLEAETFTTPTTIIMSFGRSTELRTRMMRVEGGELDMGKLAQVDAIADDVIAHRLSPVDGVARLDAIISGRSEYGRVLSTLAHVMTCGSMAVFFGGSPADVCVAGAIGISIGVLAQVTRRSTDQARVFELVGAAFAALTANVVAAVWPVVSPSLVTIASLIVLLPGLSLTVAMTELATRNLIAGTARLMSAVVVLLELVVGVALGERAADALITPHAIPIESVPQWTSGIALAIAALGVTILVQAQKRAFPWILAACVTGYLGTRSGAAWLGPQMGALVGALALGVLGNLYARRFRRPAQVVVVPAVLLLVPGGMGFRGMTSLLDRDTLTGVETVFAMFIVAIAIVAGLLVANALVPPRRSL
jgi:uncharacterized membrane protein YjjP (DUF1212 family)